MKKLILVIIVLALFSIATATQPPPYIKYYQGRIRSLETRVDCLERELVCVRERLDDFIRSSPEF